MDKDAVIALLERQLSTANHHIQGLTEQVQQLQQKLDLLLHQLYGKKSEKSKPPVKATNDNTSCFREKATPSSNKAGNRRALPKNLPRERVEYDLSAEEKVCQYCCGQKHRIGHTCTEQLDLIPAKLFVKEHRRYKYACRCGQGGVTIATMPAQPIDKGLPGPGLLAEVISSKFQDSLPLHRQMLRFKRQGIELSDNTLCDWLRHCAHWFEPIVERMQQDILADIKIHTDDTPIPVLAKGKTRQARLWVYRSVGILAPAATVYDYTPTRSQAGPLRFLANYQGYLQADAYTGYDKLYQTKPIVEVGCMAHARRKFTEVAIAAGGESTADAAIEFIARLYGIEKRAKAMTEQERYYYRRRYAKPILHQLYRWLKTMETCCLPRTPIAKAVAYMLNHWRALHRYLEHGALAIDNNEAERAIRPLVIGRKNYLFAGSHEGGKRAAIFYSIIETCKQHGVNTFDYLRDVLTRVPNTLQKDIEQLLPYRWRPLT